jgi:hypothetical protein
MSAARDGLRSTPRHLHGQDAGRFPEAHAAARRQGAPHRYCLRVDEDRVTIEFDYFFIPPEMSARVAALYHAYVQWWIDTRQPHFPRAGIHYGGFCDFCAVTVLREHAPWWIGLFREASRVCRDPFQEERRQRRMAADP